MDWNSKLLRAAEMGKTRWVRDYPIAYERPQSIIHIITVRIIDDMMIQARPVASLKARPPTPTNHRGYAASMTAYGTASDGAQVWQEPWVVDHECHHLSWISADTEELQPIVHDKILEDQMRR